MSVDSSSMGWQLTAVILYFVAMIGIGYYAFRRTRDNLDGYLLADRGLKPWIAALSAGASDMSGWLLMGLPGAVYLLGMDQAWIFIGLLIGAWLNWKLLAPRLRAYTEVADDAITIPSFLGRRLKDSSNVLRITCGIIILLFFTFYVSSGMVASGKFFDTSFGVSYTTGMLIVATVTMLYTLIGGFLGASLTDVAQGTMVVIALLAVPVIGIVNLGGIGPTIDGVRAFDANHLSLVSGASVLGIISAAAWGLGYFGQPHIIVRFMALRSPADAPIARRIGISWMALCGIGAVGTALVGAAYYGRDGLSDPETVFLGLSQALFHPFVAGLVLAAVLAAIMSTISSQMIVCSSALVEDLYKLILAKTGRREPSQKTYVQLGRLGVLAIAIIAMLLALDPESSVLSLVAFAWAGFGAAFGPVIILALYWRRLTTPGALAGIITGAAVVFVWGQTALSDRLYEIVPGFVAAFVLAVVVSLMTPRTDAAAIDAEFAASVELARAPRNPEHAVNTTDA